MVQAGHVVWLCGDGGLIVPALSQKGQAAVDRILRSEGGRRCIPVKNDDWCL